MNYSTPYKLLFVIEITSVIYWTKSPSGEFLNWSIFFSRSRSIDCPCRNRSIIGDIWYSVMSPARYYKPHRSLRLWFFVSFRNKWAHSIVSAKSGFTHALRSGGSDDCMASLYPAVYVSFCIYHTTVLYKSVITTDFKSGFSWTSAVTRNMVVTFYRDGEFNRFNVYSTL